MTASTGIYVGYPTRIICNAHVEVHQTSYTDEITEPPRRDRPLQDKLNAPLICFLYYQKTSTGINPWFFPPAFTREQADLRPYRGGKPRKREREIGRSSASARTPIFRSRFVSG